MNTVPRTYTIPKNLDATLHSRVGKGNISKFVTEALWDALRKEEEAYIQDIIASNSDPAALELRKDFAYLEGQDFVGIEDFNFDESENGK